MEWHPGELYPRVGYIVTNLSYPTERVVAFYNQRGKAEQYIKVHQGEYPPSRRETYGVPAVRSPNRPNKPRG